MLRRKNLFDRRYKKFYAILAPLVKNWSWSEYVSPEVNMQAKADLCAFLRQAKLLLPKAKIYDFEPLGYHEGGGILPQTTTGGQTPSGKTALG